MGTFFKIGSRIGVVGVFLLLPLIYRQETLGFHPFPSSVDLPYRMEWEGSHSIDSEIRKILGQPFRFLGLGSQAHVFESQDGRYVLKLFRYHRSRFSWIHDFKGWVHHRFRAKKKLPLGEKIAKTCTAYALAMNEVPEQTGLLWIHLNVEKGQNSRGENETDLLPIAELIDPLGRTWHLPLHAYRFALQYKVRSFSDSLLHAYRNRDDKALREMLTSFAALLAERTSRGIRNSDPNLGPNFGFLGTKAIEIDVGNFRKQPDMLTDENLKIQEIERFVRPLRHWLNKHCPEYTSSLGENH